MAENGVPSTGEAYEIRIQGQLHCRWADWFDGFEMIGQANGDTVLRGPVADQSALHSVLDKIRDLNVKLISVNRVAGSR